MREMTIEEMERAEQEEARTYEVRDVSTAEELEFLKKDWAITWVGLSTDKESIEALLDFVKKYTPIFKREVWISHGDLMNKTYGLTGPNAYPDDLTIVSIPLCQIMFPDNLSEPRIACGGRWMWDIVENNLARERLLKKAQEESKTTK